MPVNVGDAVLTFMGDTTQLDLAFDKVNEQAEAKLVPAAQATERIGDGMKKSGAEAQEAGSQMTTAWQRVANATLQNNQAQQALKSALEQIKKTGGEDVVTMLQLAQAQQNAARASHELALATKEAQASIEGEDFAMKEATGTLALGGELIGVKLPRHVRSFVAELPGVGAALEAAFAFTAVLILVDVLAKGIEKLVEWSEAGERLHEGWLKLDGTFQDTSTHIQEEIEKQEEKFIQLTEGPIAALEFAMKHLRSTAMDTLKSISSELEQAVQQFKDASPWYEFGVGWAKASKQLKEFDTALTETMRKAAAEHPDDPMAAYRAGVTKTQEDLEALQKKYDAFITDLQRKGSADLFDQNQMLAWQKQIEILTNTLHQLQQGQKLDNDRAKADAEAKLKAQQQLQLAQTEQKKQGALAEIALEDEKNQILFERGKLSYDELEKALKAHENRKFKIQQDALKEQIDFESDPAKKAQLQGQLEALQKEHQGNLLKIDQDAYKHRSDVHTKFVETLIAATKEGSQERIDLETGLLNYYKMMWGEGSDIFQQQLAKVNAAKRAQVEEHKKLIDEERRGEEALANDKAQADNQYFAYLVQTGRLAASKLLEIQQDAAEEAYRRKKTALEKELRELGPEEVIARTKVLNDLALLDQQHQEKVRLYQLQTQDVVETSFKELGIKSVATWDKEVLAAQEAYRQIRNTVGTTLADLLRAQERVLQAQIGEALAKGDKAKLQEYTAQLALLQQQMEKMGLTAKKTATSMAGWLDQFGQKLKATRGELHGFQSTFDTVIGDATNVFGSAITQWIEGQKSLGEALREGLAAELATIAGKAAAWSLYFLAWGIADAFWNPARSGADFAAAAEFAAVAALAGGAAYAIAPHNSKGSSGNTSSTSSVTGGNSGTSNPQPVQAVNVQHFAQGALVSGPTLAMIGDNVNGTPKGAREAALPLDHPDALRQIGEALGPYVAAAAGGGGGDMHFHIEGLISPDNLNKVVKQISVKVKKNQAVLYSSKSLGVTRR